MFDIIPSKIPRNVFYTSVFDGSVSLRLLWMSLLMLRDEDGLVEVATVKGLANIVELSEEDTRAGLAILEAPDPTSSDIANEGCRLTRVPGGWLVNESAEFYAICKRERQKEATRPRVARWRAKRLAPKAGPDWFCA